MLFLSREENYHNQWFYKKRTQKLPQGEKELALKAYHNYEKRIKAETYYEEEN